MENTFDKICERLYGESKWQQEKKLKRLLVVTGVLCVLAILGMIIYEPEDAAFFAVIIAIIWSWGFVRAMAATVGRIISFFDNDIAIFVISVIIWLFLGLIGGAVSLILGIIRFIQLKRE